MGKLMTAVAATVLVVGPAAAFYFPGWPADGLPRAPNLYGPAGGQWPVGEISTESLLTRPPPAVLPPSRPVPAQSVPEPTTLVLATAGLAMLIRRRPGERPA